MRNSKGQFVKGNKLGLQKGHKINIGRKYSKETIIKIRESNLGLKRSEQTRENIRNARIGKKSSPETCRKISERNKRLGIKPPVGSHLGYKHTKEAKMKIGLANTGHIHSEETKRKIGEALKGEKSSFWKDGRTKQKGYASFYERRRQIKKLNNGGSHTLFDWQTLKAQYNLTCPCCKRHEPEIKLTEDHIIPITRGGSDNIENIQPLCGTCNTKKMVKIIKYEFSF